MSRVAKFFLLVIAPLLAVLLALLGWATLPANPLGWLLLLVGASYAAGLVIVYGFRQQKFWESSLSGSPTGQEHGDRSLWLIALGISAVFYLSPLEYIGLPAYLPRTPWNAFCGLALVVMGIALFAWARRTLGKSYAGHVSVKLGQPLVQSGPYRMIRHPAYAGYFLMAFGFSLGYSSLAGILALFALLLPGVIYRMKVEEQLLIAHFGEDYRQYQRKTKRLVPMIW